MMTLYQAQESTKTREQRGRRYQIDNSCRFKFWKGNFFFLFFLISFFVLETLALPKRWSDFNCGQSW